MWRIVRACLRCLFPPRERCDFEREQAEFKAYFAGCEPCDTGV